MEYRSLPLSCECGGKPKRISGVGLSTNHHLVIQWRCPRCRRIVFVVKPLADCVRDCPTEAATNRAGVKVVLDSPDDRAFLHSVGVRYPDEQ